MKENQSSVTEIYNICHMLHMTSGLEVRFIDAEHKSSFQFKMNTLPDVVEAARQNVDKNITALMKEQGEKDFLYYSDSFKLSYLAVGKWKKGVYMGAIIAGPFLFDLPDEAFLSKVIEKNKLQLGIKQRLLNFYKSLTMLEVEKYTYLGHLMVNLAVNTFINGKIVLISDISSKTNLKEEAGETYEELHSNIELRYKMQNELSNAVEKGMKEEAFRIFGVLKFNPSNRVPDNPFRAFKNFTYSFNTILRIAIEKGGVHPVFVHNISDRFAVQIEKIENISELEKLQLTMVAEYCDAVKKYSASGYSPVVRNAINHIYLKFESQLSLIKIAENININPSHLARQFKKETGLTVTEFINRRRVEEAKYLISQGRYSITEIALMTGFENHNYFSSVFKKLTSMTPSEYQKGEKMGHL